MQALSDMVANIAKECKDPTVLGTFSEVCRLERFWHKRRELI
jgi:hypothetical protein